MHSKALAAHHFLLFVTRSLPRRSASLSSALCDLLCALFVRALPPCCSLFDAQLSPALYVEFIIAFYLARTVSFMAHAPAPPAAGAL